MSVDVVALQKAFNALARDLGPLDDLAPAVRNTLANVYYRFHLVGANLSNPADALKLTGRDVMSLYQGFMEGMGRVIAEFESAAELVRSVRDVRREDPGLFDYCQTHFLDVFKYRISDANNKPPWRRALERPFRKVDEIPNLYDRMLNSNAHREHFSSERDRTSPPKSSPRPGDSFTLSPSMPDVTQRPPIAIHSVADYIFLLVKDARPLGERLTGGHTTPIAYLYVMTVLDRREMKPRMFVTLERGLTHSLFLCAFERSGERVNLGDGTSLNDADSFTRAAITHICRVLNLDGRQVRREAP